MNMNMKTATAAILATTALSFGLAGLSYNAMAKPYMQNDEHAQVGDAKQCQHKHGKHKYSHNHAYRYLKRTARQLNLTEQQIEDIKDIFEQAHIEQQEKAQYSAQDRPKKLKDLDPGAPNYLEQAQEVALERAKKAEQKVLAHAQIFAKVHAILTPEQQAKAAELRTKKIKKPQKSSQM